MVGEGAQSPKRSRLKRQMRTTSDYNQTVICVSNATNSRLPDDMKSRIFIGNLNTNIITKRHLHLLFNQFGEIKAISMHKGYAFIQYEDEMDALNAVFSQDGQMVAGQVIDVNLVTEPKPHQRAAKIPNNNELPIEMNGENAGILNSMECDSECSDVSKNTEGETQQLSGLSELDIDECGIKNKPEMKTREQTLLKTTCSLIDDGENDVSMINEKKEEGLSKRAKLDAHLNDDNSCELIADAVPQQGLQMKKQELSECLDEESERNIFITSSNADEQSSLSKEDTKSTNNDSIQSQESVSNNKRLKTEVFPLIPIDNNPLAAQIHPQDILICGNCKSLFNALSLFIQHKKSRCRLRFVCHCQSQFHHLTT